MARSPTVCSLAKNCAVRGTMHVLACEPGKHYVRRRWIGAETAKPHLPTGNLGKLQFARKIPERYRT